MKSFFVPIIIGLSVVAGFAAESELEAALAKLKLPGITLNVKERYVDVDATVCLDTGALELVACIKETKEHESLVMVNAKAVHIHAALLLIGAKAGNPAMRKSVGGKEDLRWIDIPPAGGPVRVLLVIPDDKGGMIERPISDFIQRVESDDRLTGRQSDEKVDRNFPTSTFLFLGSHLLPAKEGPRKYLADESGNVISISTFGDELLGMEQVFGQENDSLMWEVNPEHLPVNGTKVVMRLKPVFGN